VFDHVEVPVAAIGPSRKFFAAVLGELEIEEFFFDRKAGSAGFGAGDVTGLLIFDGDFGPRRLHVCFSASSS
jgi:catechol 2,3-dioxygenase-like lactoylglutathione lyase family enzyme